MDELISAVNVPESALMVYGIGVLLVVVAATALLLVVEAVCVFALGVHIAWRPLSARASRGGKMPVATALVAALGLTPLAAQQGARPVPTVEPRFTRIFASDSMNVGQAALSPNGRWVVFQKEEGAAAYNLWIVAASGGEPIRLTSGRYSDGFPVWFPAGDRIAFWSDRASDRTSPTTFVMTLAVDPQTGRPVGSPRQVSLEGTQGYVAVAPDGESIAYQSFSNRRPRLVVIPASGGAARVVVEYGDSMGAIQALRWSPDGEWLWFIIRPRAADQRRVVRVRAAGGRPQELGRLPMGAPIFTFFSLDGRYVITSRNDGPGEGQLHQLFGTDGRVIARIALRRDMRLTGFTPDGSGLMVRQTNAVAPIRVVPVAGGPSRQVTDGREYDWPLGWSGDGATVFVQSASNGHNTLLQIPVGGGPAVEFTIPDEARSPFVLSRDGRYVQYAVETDGSARAFRIRRLSDGRARDLTANGVRSSGVSETGPGGSYLNGEEFLHFRRQADRLELWATAPEGQPRLLRAFPASMIGQASIGVHGQRTAYIEPRGDSTALYVAEGRTGPARHLATVAGGARGPTWSHNGDWIAYDYYPPGQNPRHSVLVVGVGPDGSLTAVPRVLESGAMWGWQIRWLPGDQAVTIFGMTGAGSETHVYLVPIREGERPVVITRDDPSIKWGYELSPDGRYVAYPAEIPRGSSIWLVDLREVLARANGGGGARRP